MISDTSQFAPGIPAITYGLKGLAYFELVVRGARTDLHSGTFGGAVANPCNALATLLASLKGSDGRIRIAGFYDDVRPLEDWERAAFARLPFSEDEFRGSSASLTLEGEAIGYTTLFAVDPADLRHQRHSWTAAIQAGAQDGSSPHMARR